MIHSLRANTSRVDLTFPPTGMTVSPLGIHALGIHAFGRTRQPYAYYILCCLGYDRRTSLINRYVPYSAIILIRFYCQYVVLNVRSRSSQYATQMSFL
jgi:hypothetical protein